MGSGQVPQGLAKRTVCRDPARHHQGLHPGSPHIRAKQRGLGPIDQRGDRSRLEARGKVSHGLIRQFSDLDMAPDGGFEARKGKIIALGPGQGPRQSKTRGIAAARRLLDSRPARKPQPQQLRRLVKGLAHGIVDGRTQPPELPHPLANEQLAVPARNQQQQIGIGNALHQPRRQRMRLQVVEGDKRLAAGQRQRLGHGEPDGNPADKPRPGRHRNPVQLIKPQPRITQRALDDRVDQFRMRAGRDLGDDAPIGPVRIELAGDHVGQDTPRPRRCAGDDGRGCFVAAGFNAKHGQHEGSTRSTRWKIWRSFAIIYSLRRVKPPLSPELPSVQTPIRIGTRGSPLALAQTRLVIAALARAHGWTPDEAAARTLVVTVKTSGDRIQDRPLADLGGKGLFAKELEEALLRNEIDCAVHSLKDMPTALPEGLILECTLPREDPRDALVCSIASSIADLPLGARFATGSVRRQAQVLNLRPDLTILPLRGNVDTRLAKVSGGEVDATLLAMAGLRRLGKPASVGHALETDVFLPAVAQGAIGVETRSANAALREMLDRINDCETHLAVSLEREFLSILDGSCKTPIAGYARRSGDGNILFEGCALSPDGRTRFDVRRSSSLTNIDEAKALGRSAGEELLAKAGRPFFQV
jgi:hydroxymethylbilane synthase